MLSGDENNRGSISSGKWAGLAVFSGDPLTTPDELLGLVVEHLHGGRAGL
jgi:predicted amidohydrolase YtcJ